MTDKRIEPGYPVVGGADEKLAHFESLISPSEIQSAAVLDKGNPVWILGADGGLHFAKAVIETKAAE